MAESVAPDPAATEYNLALGAHGNFGQANTQLWADSLAEAITKAEEQFPGMYVHTAYAIKGEGAREEHRTDEELTKWMSSHHRKEENGGWNGYQDSQDG